MYKQNADKVREIVGDKRGVCGLWRCQVCRNGQLYDEVDEEGSMWGSCTNPDCAEHEDKTR